MRRSPCALSGLLFGVLVVTAGPAPEASAGAAPLRIGMVQTFFNDVPPPLVQIVIDPFGTIMRETTGLAGELLVGGDAFTVARQLGDGKLQLAVFHGHEFAWVQHKHPELQPLMVAINAQRAVRAYVLVRKDSPASAFADLKGKEVAVPKRTREHCRVYLEGHCKDDGHCGAKEFFGTVAGPANIEAALDQLCGGKVDAVVVDSIGLEFYKALKPGCFARLRVLNKSDAFPAPVIAYRQGSLDEPTLSRLRDGLRGAHKTDMGRDMMRTWKITSFEPVPDDYPQALAACLKTYPCPEAKN
jgi:ABC-type phosphate/phosphonate transport system substrate-binding protein